MVGSLRITPAGAGKTQGRNVITSINRDHPRRCGENLLIQSATAQLIGSPPQVRGKPSAKAPEEETDRITPAGAGKTAGFRRFS